MVFAPLEMEAQEQGEDLVQAENVYPGRKRRTLDVGWYQNHYMVRLIEGSDWRSPIQKIKCQDLGSAMEAFKTLSI